MGEFGSFLHFGVGGKNGTFAGTIESIRSIRKVGPGRQDLTGVLDLNGQPVYVSDGVLAMSDSAASGVSKIIVEPNGTFVPFGNVSAQAIEGGGTVAINSQSLAVGESNANYDRPHDLGFSTPESVSS